MLGRITAVFTAAFLAVVSFVPTAKAQTGQALPTGLAFPINQSGAQGVFQGTLRITSFAVENGALVASGIVTGTLQTTGGATSVVRTVTMPVSTAPSAKGAPIVAKAGSCGILHLELGPLDLDVLGLVVHLDKVVLDISAVPGAGNLLGNLLCSITNLLNGGGALAQIANLLNQILAILGG